MIIGREGLMDDCGYHGIDEAEEFAEKYCMKCVNMPMEINEKGELVAVDCDKDCCLADPRFFESEK